MALMEPFRWLEELATKPIAVCLVCRQPFFPHLGGCQLGCEKFAMFEIYQAVVGNAALDKILLLGRYGQRDW